MAADRRILVVLVVTQVLSGVGVAIGVTTSGVAVLRLAGSEALAGLAQATTLLGAALIALPLGRMAARRGRRWSLSAGYAVGTLGAAAAALAVGLGSWPLLVGAMLLLGAGTAANFAARYAVVDPGGAASPRNGGRRLSVMVFATAGGVVVGPNLAVVGENAAGTVGLPGDTGPFLLVATTFALAGLGVFRWLRPDPLPSVADRLPSAPDLLPEVEGRGSGAVRVSSRRAVEWVTELRRLPTEGLLALGAVVAAHGAMTAMMTMTPVHLYHGGASLSGVGVVLSSHFLGMYAFSPLFGWLVDRHGAVPVLGLGAAMLVAGVGLSGMAPDHEAPQLAAGLTVLGMGWSGLLVSASLALTEATTRELRPLLQGLSDTVMSMSGVAGAVVAGLVVSAASFAMLGVLVGLATLPLLVAAVVVSLRHT
ncbi:MFS transporter [Actinoalloteichus spitiensis]|uniref:MFS transporter n=1 Tax=Actinoalloteichus spitiensis TaxID=252394 RepID=UPI0003641BB0|nr:MFS transporter [Actinoalloteichus spitiensis]